MWYEGTGTTSKSWLYADHQSSIVGQSNSSGTSTAIYSYGPYCEPNVTTGSRFCYTGQQYLSGLGLYYYKARFYSPMLGRFLQTDPIGYRDDMNLYAYVGGNPANRSDPTGLSATEAACLTGGVGGVNFANGTKVAALGAVVPFVIEVVAPRLAPYLIPAAGTALGGYAAQNLDFGTIFNQGASPALPEGLVGVQDSDARQQGNRHNSGTLSPSSGGSGDAGADFDTLTGGKHSPAPSDSSYPKGTLIGDNGVTLRPEKGQYGPRIDIPANGSKPHETLHYPKP